MKLLIADDHVLFREALHVYLSSKCPDWDIHLCSNVEETLTILETDANNIDLVLLDLRMPGMNGLEGLKIIRSTYPDLRVSILSGVAEEHHVKQAVEIGADAYLPKTLSAKTLTKAIELIVTTGQRFIPMDKTGLKPMPSYIDDFQVVQTARDILPQEDENKRTTFLKTLTKREKQVLHYLGQGLTNNDIAAELQLQPTTIKIYVGKLCKKLEVDNRTQAALLCQQYNLNNY